MVLLHCQKSHQKCFWQCSIWRSDIWVARICSCRNVACWWHRYTKVFKYLDNLIARDIDKETFDDLHQQLVKDAQRQTERDFPCMSVCNGITDGTKMCGSERVGNAFILLCLFHTQLGQKLIATYRAVSINSYKECLKLYLSFDPWVNGPHTQREV